MANNYQRIRIEEVVGNAGIGKVNVINFVGKRLEGDVLVEGLGEDLFDFVTNLLLGKDDNPKVLLNFTGVTYAKPAFGKLKRFRNLLVAGGGKLLSCCVGEDMFESFQNHGLLSPLGAGEEVDRDMVTTLELFRV